MLGRLSMLVRSFRAASHWSKALDRAAEGEYAAALTCLRSVYDVLEISMPSDRVTCDINILCANIAFKLGDYNLSLAAATIAVNQLDHDAEELSLYERGYLGVFCRNMLEYFAYKTKDERFARLAASIEVDFHRALLPKVGRSIVKNFPITGLQ